MHELWSESEIIECVSMFWIFRSCCEEWRFGFFFRKYIKSAFVWDQTADVKHRALTLGSATSFDHVATFQREQTAKNPDMSPRLAHAVTHGCCVSNYRRLFLLFQLEGLICCCFKFCAAFLVWTKSPAFLLRIDNTQVFLLLFQNGKLSSLACWRWRTFAYLSSYVYRIPNIV